MPYVESLLAFLDPLSGARCLQTLTTKRIDKAVECLIVIALLYTAMELDAKLEPHRDIFEHYWTLITKRLHMFAPARSIGDAVAERFLIDSRVRLARSLGFKHQAERFQQDLRDVLYRHAERLSPRNLFGQIVMLWDFFMSTPPYDNEWDRFSLSDEHPESRSSGEVEDDGIWICPDCGSENVDEGFNANYVQEGDEDEELSHRNDAEGWEDEEQGAEVEAQSDDGFSSIHYVEGMLMCSNCGAKYRDVDSNSISPQEDDEDEEFSDTSLEADDEEDAADPKTLIDGPSLACDGGQGSSYRQAQDSGDL